MGLILIVILHVRRQAGNNEKNLIVFLVQTKLIGKMAFMVVARIEHKLERLGIGIKF
jgi:hypothetical protein